MNIIINCSCYYKITKYNSPYRINNDKMVIKYIIFIITMKYIIPKLLKK